MNSWLLYCFFIQHSTFNIQHSTFNIQHSTINNQQSTINNQQSPIFSLQYSVSTLYHAISNVRWKPLLRMFDHICIYFLIAGYTPLALISLEHSSGWTIFWTVWGVAAVGTILKVFFTGKFETISLVLYLVMGWLIAIDFNSVVEIQSSLGITLLALGGAFYTIGIVFYAAKKIPYNHAIWHFFVLAGSIFHYFFIFMDVI